MNTDKSEVLQGTLDLMILNSLHALGSLYGFRITLRIEQVSEDVLTWIFNVGMLLSGIAAIVGSYGLFRAFRRRAGLVWSLLVGIGVLATGVTTFKSGLYPLPDPRHTSWGFLSVFIIAIPLLLLIAAWRARLPASLRYYLTFSVALVLVLFPFMSGIISVSHPGKGTFQRLFAIANFIPVGITAYALRTRQ